MPNELNVTPTKGSLIAIQKSLELSTLGFDLLDRNLKSCLPRRFTRTQKVLPSS